MYAFSNLEVYEFKSFLCYEQCDGLKIWNFKKKSITLSSLDNFNVNILMWCSDF